MFLKSAFLTLEEQKELKVLPKGLGASLKCIISFSESQSVKLMYNEVD